MNSNKIDSIPTSTDRCTGCSACASICPAHAIKMTVDEEGFRSPVFDSSLCTNCKLCLKVCPIVECKFNKQSEETYAVTARDNEVRLSCSSGGVAYVLSKYIIEQGGYVCGCITDGFKTYHEIISKDNYHLFDKLKGSKYVQSDINDVFIKIKSLLKSNKQILFIGSGCQVAGLKKFLIKPYKNLITVDFICHGVPSPKILDDYISHLKQTYYTASTYSTRDKIDGWQALHEFNLFDDNGNRLYRANGRYDVYILSFLSKYISRQSCSTCAFARPERVSDITLGDYWKIRKFNKELDDKKGTSLVLINTDMGKKLLHDTRQYFDLFEPVPWDFAKSVQPHLTSAPTENRHRKRVFDMFKKGGDYFSFLNKKMFRVGILNFHFANNYGAVLVAFSLQTIIQRLGYIPEIINYIGKKFRKNSNFISFRDNFLITSPLIEDYDALVKFQKKYKKIVVGSDQVWRLFDQNVYMLKFATGSKSLISYAASFGGDDYEPDDKEKAKELLKRFSAISVREFSGVDIVNSQFNLPAVRVLDPTLLLSASEYQKIIDFYKPQEIESDYIGYGFVNKKNKEIIGNFELLMQDKFSLRLKNILMNFDDSHSNSVGGWLSYIKNSKFVIADSFHIIVFSIIFRKDFVCLVTSVNGSDRIPSLLKLFGIDQKRIIRNINDIDPKIVNEHIDYDSVYKILEKEKEKALRYLKDSLNIAPKDLPEI